MLTFKRKLKLLLTFAEKKSKMNRTYAVVVVSELKAGEAEAVVGSHGVFTGAVTARLSFTLIDV